MCFITINLKFNLFDYNNLQDMTPLLNVFIVAVVVVLVFVVIREGGRLFFTPSTSANCPGCYKKPVPEENEENSWQVRKRCSVAEILINCSFFLRWKITGNCPG